jgi:hypothetical protein
MTDTQIDQIEYRHHQTRDLSPVATSMSSRDSLRGWDSQISAWVRHPHADRLSESLCYQVFSTGKAAVAWRYWDQRAAERADGSRGRPIVSRVLVGPLSVLTPAVAVALCLVGPADLVGPMPGEVQDDDTLPTVSGAALAAVAREKASELDRDALKLSQPGLQALVAAALADPFIPLAISIRDVIIQKPLRDGVQYPLLWGLHRIIGRLLGPDGRGWSFSTFELPLGETDPSTLPAIVFRQALDGTQAPPVRYRKEAKVRPLAPDALNRRHPYAAWYAFAGSLVEEYEKRGGNGLDQFIAECCSGETALQRRINRVADELRNTESPVIISSEPVNFVKVSSGRAPAREPEGTEPRIEAIVPDSRNAEPEARDAEPASQSAEPESREPEQDAGTAEGLQGATAGHPQAQAQVPDSQNEEPDPAAADDASQTADAPSEAVPATTSEPVHSQIREPDGTNLAAEQARALQSREVQPADTEPREIVPVGFVPVHAETVTSGRGAPEHFGHEEPLRGDSQFTSRDEKMRAATTQSREGKMAPSLNLEERGGRPPGGHAVRQQEERYSQPSSRSTVSQLLKDLELSRSNRDRCDSILQDIFRIGYNAEDGDRSKSWEIISEDDWYQRLTQNYPIHPDYLTGIFSITLIPDLNIPGRVEEIILWARKAPPEMIRSLLVAAQTDSPDVQQSVIHILEPVLAARWALDNSIFELWNPDRIMRNVPQSEGSDHKRVVRNPFRRHSNA